MAFLNRVCDKVFVINMEKDKDRLETFDNCMKENKIVYERFNGIDGTKVTRDERLTEYCNTFCTDGMKGCALSHRSLWDVMVKYGYKNIMVFEDDAIIDKDFDKRFNHVWNDLPKDYDIMYFGCTFGCTDKSVANSVYKFWKLIETEQVNDTIYTSKGGMGMHGYMLSLEGAKKFVTKPIGFHVDTQIYRWISQFNYNAYTVNINMVESNNNDSNMSDKYPLLLNSVLKRIPINNNKNPTKLDWAFSENFFKIGPFNINILLILMTILASLISPKHYYILLLWLSLELFVSVDFKNTIRYLIFMTIPMGLKLYYNKD